MADTQAIRRRLMLSMTAATLTEWWSEDWPATLEQLDRAATAARALTSPLDLRLRGHADEIVAAFMTQGAAYEAAVARAGGMNLREASLRHARAAIAPLLRVEVERLEQA